MTVVSEEVEGVGLGIEDLPSPGVPVLVQCEGYRCLAARDDGGAWRTYPRWMPIVERVLRVLHFGV